MGFRESCVAFQLRDQLIVGVGLLPRQINVEGQQRNQAYDRHVIWSRANLPKLSPVHKSFSRSKICHSEPGEKARRGTCSSLCAYSPAAFGPLRGLSASASSITGAGPEIPPSFRTRQKCTIIRIEATIGMPMQCQM